MWIEGMTQKISSQEFIALKNKIGSPSPDVAPTAPPNYVGFEKS